MTINLLTRAANLCQSCVTFEQLHMLKTSSIRCNDIALGDNPSILLGLYDQAFFTGLNNDAHGFSFPEYRS